MSARVTLAPSTDGVAENVGSLPKVSPEQIPGDAGVATRRVTVLDATPEAASDSAQATLIVVACWYEVELGAS